MPRYVCSIRNKDGAVAKSVKFIHELAVIRSQEDLAAAAQVGLNGANPKQNFFSHLAGFSRLERFSLRLSIAVADGARKINGGCLRHDHDGCAGNASSMPRNLGCEWLPSEFKCWRPYLKHMALNSFPSQCIAVLQAQSALQSQKYWHGQSCKCDICLSCAARITNRSIYFYLLTSSVGRRLLSCSGGRLALQSRRLLYAASGWV